MSSFERVTTSVLTMAACAIAVSLIHREFFTRTEQKSPATERPPEYVPEWTKLVEAGISLGDRNARVLLVEFADLECPACRLFREDVEVARKQFGKGFAAVFVHFPLPQHRFARPAARAAECANEQGRFDEFHGLIYEKQDSLGLKSWVSFASESRVPDLAHFDKCASDTVRVARIEEGVRLGKELAVAGTPTVLLNGWRYRSPPNRVELLRGIEMLAAGKMPE